MNKLGQTISAGFVFALFLGIVLLLFLTGGGASKILSITKVLGQIPAWVWVILVVVFVFSRWGK
jgi:hypothetical protein